MAEKICVVCGEDCSDRPRVKDQKGRYRCRRCEEARARAKTAASSPGEEELDPYALEDDEPLAGLLDDVAPARSCPVCVRPMAGDAKICVGCGYDPEKGVQTSTLVEKSAGRGGRRHQCDNCGYDITGLRDPVCPECGERIRLRGKGKIQQDVEREMLITEWRRPLIWLAIGLGVMLPFNAVTGGIEAVIAYPILLLAQVLVGYVVLWLCFMFLGDLGTPLLNFVRLAGIYASLDVIALIVSPIPIVGWLLPLAAYISMFSNTFEVDWTDALIVIFLTGLAKIAMGVAIAMFVLNQLGL